MNNPEKPRPHNRYVYRFWCAVAITAMALATFLFVWINFASDNNTTGYLLGLGNLGMASAIYVVIFAFAGVFLHAFKIGVERKSKQIASVILTVFFTDVIEVLMSIAILGDFRYILALTWRYALLAVAQSIILGITEFIMVNLYRILVSPMPILVIQGDHDNRISANIDKIHYKYHISDTIRYDEDPEKIREAINNAEGVLINDVPPEVTQKIIKFCYETDTRTYIVPKVADIILKSSDNLNVIDTPLYLCRNLGANKAQLFIKRLMDILLSLIAVIVLSPILLITAIAIKAEDKGPVFYRQERVTKDGKKFMILKFRSMIVDAEKDGKPRPAGAKDDRITKVGHVIRACRVDELPQLFNILKGEMSIVGPRPERVEHVEAYKQDIPEFVFREKMKGGLTGYAQVYGKYNTTALDKLKLDLIYITNFSIFLDIQIIFETIKILFQKESTEGFDEQRAQEMHDKAKV